MGELILGFPGTGKTTFAEKQTELKVLDLDSSTIRWNEDGSKNENFVSEYVDRLEKSVDDYDIVFGSTHKEVVEELNNRGVDHTIIVPLVGSKEEYMDRYINRGSSDAFIDHMHENYEKYINDIMESDSTLFVINHGENIEYALTLLEMI